MIFKLSFVNGFITLPLNLLDNHRSDAHWISTIPKQEPCWVEFWCWCRCMIPWAQHGLSVRLMLRLSAELEALVLILLPQAARASDHLHIDLHAHLNIIIFRVFHLSRSVYIITSIEELRNWGIEELQFKNCEVYWSCLSRKQTLALACEPWTHHADSPIVEVFRTSFVCKLNTFELNNLNIFTNWSIVTCNL